MGDGNRGQGGVDWKKELSPQQATLPLMVTPQVWYPPALTLWKVPVGGEVWPSVSHPQHVTLPLVVTPQLWYSPALTCVG